MWNTYREFWWGLIAFSLFVTLFLILALAGWPGGANSCTLASPDTCFCEAFSLASPTGIRQPGNTFSNLGYVVSGLVILFLLGKAREQGAAATNPMSTPNLKSVTFGAIVLFLGPASMLFHGSLTGWGGFADGFSLVLFGTFLFLYDLAAVTKMDDALFAFLFFGIVLVAGSIALATEGKDILGLSVGTFVFAIFVIAFLVLDAVVVFRGTRVRRDWWPWWGLAVLSFAIAFFFFWLGSQTGDWMCNLTGSSTPFQGHAFWQLTSAVTTFSLFAYFRTQAA